MILEAMRLFSGFRLDKVGGKGKCINSINKSSLVSLITFLQPNTSLKSDSLRCGNLSILKGSDWTI